MPNYATAAAALAMEEEDEWHYPIHFKQQVYKLSS